MEGILHTFGIDGRLIVIQLFNFALLLAALWYFLYAPVMKMLNERQEKIARGIEDAEAAGKARVEADTEKKTILSAAEKEAEAVAERARAHAQEKAEAIVTAANEKAADVAREAEAKSQELKEQARRESEAEIAKLAVLAAEKVLRKEA